MRLDFSEFTKPECDYLREQCNFTDSEQAVFDMRCKGVSIVAIAITMHMSEKSVNRRIRAVKAKIAKVM